PSYVQFMPGSAGKKSAATSRAAGACGCFAAVHAPATSRAAAKRAVHTALALRRTGTHPPIGLGNLGPAARAARNPKRPYGLYPLSTQPARESLRAAAGGPPVPQGASFGSFA